ncbi:hypothetical protein ASG92_24770 [Arthrobacter sp. Soil736]|nr:hypothetical protein ASG92_24770 [Arthrobacter sp. Soil736]
MLEAVEHLRRHRRPAERGLRGVVVVLDEIVEPLLFEERDGLVRRGDPRVEQGHGGLRGRHAEDLAEVVWSGRELELGLAPPAARPLRIARNGLDQRSAASAASWLSSTRSSSPCSSRNATASSAVVIPASSRATAVSGDATQRTSQKLYGVAVNSNSALRPPRLVRFARASSRLLPLGRSRAYVSTTRRCTS